jgi:hypothetical protein
MPGLIHSRPEPEHALILASDIPVHFAYAHFLGTGINESISGMLRM